MSERGARQNPFRKTSASLWSAAATGWDTLTGDLRARGWGRLRPALRHGLRRLRDPQPPAVSEEIRAIEAPISSVLAHVEIVLILVVALFATREYANLNPDLKMAGHEGEWLTSSAHYAALSLREYGYIPLWQPLLESGEPLIESPFSFILNPISIGPSLLLGGINGIKISVVLYTMLAGAGGWVLGRVLGLGSLGRMLLGLLLIGKGNMLAMIGEGYFQLGVTQAYFPWIIAGTIAIFRFRHRRWPVVLTAAAFTWMFLAGNIWYTVPMVMSMAALAAFYGVDLRTRTVDWIAMRRLALAGVLTLGLSAVLLVPVWANRDRIGGHPPDLKGGVAADWMKVIEQFYDGRYEPFRLKEAPGAPQFYFSFTSPLWFIALAGATFPLTRRFRYPTLSRLWWAGLLLVAVFTVWGMSGPPIMTWLYRHVPGLGQWRFVGRALAVASFWLAALIAMRIDTLVWHINRSGWQRRLRRPLAWTARGAQVALTLALMGASLAAARQVVRQWYTFAGVSRLKIADDTCVTWLRFAFRHRELAVYRHNYDAIITFLENDARHANIESDYFPIPLASTLSTAGKFDWTRLLPGFGLAWEDYQRAYLVEHGYEELSDSPDPLNDGHHCLYYKSDVFAYAFAVPLARLESVGGKNVTPADALPVAGLNRKPDDITVRIEAVSEPTVVTVQERAYPGWQVTLDGHSARLESVGGLIGIVVEPDGAAHAIRFRYRPPLLVAGSVVTLLASAFAGVYVAHGDRHALRELDKFERVNRFLDEA